MLKFLNRRFLLRIILIGLVVWLGSSALVAWKLTRRSGGPTAEPAPDATWAAFESLRLPISDGEEIGAWLVRGDPQRGCVLVLHGYRASRSKMLPVVRLLAEARYTVLAVSLRAHGDSSGTINDFGFSARRDVTAAIDFLEIDFPGRPLAIVGRSMGAAAAIFAAKDLKGRIAGYFLEQPYKDLKSAVWNRLQHYLPPGFDWIAYGGMRLWAPVILPTSIDLVSPYDHIQDIPERVPVMFLAGTADRHAHLNEVTSMYRRIGSQAELEVFEGAEHTDLDKFDFKHYSTTLLHFLDRTLIKQRESNIE